MCESWCVCGGVRVCVPAYVCVCVCVCTCARVCVCTPPPSVFIITYPPPHLHLCDLPPASPSLSLIPPPPPTRRSFTLLPLHFYHLIARSSLHIYHLPTFTCFISYPHAALPHLYHFPPPPPLPSRFTHCSRPDASFAS